MKEELKEIRNELMIGVENNDMLYIKMQINKIDTLIYNLKDCKRSKKSSIYNQPYDLNNAPGFRKGK